MEQKQSLSFHIVSRHPIYLEAFSSIIILTSVVIKKYKEDDYKLMWADSRLILVVPSTLLPSKVIRVLSTVFNGKIPHLGNSIHASNRSTINSYKIS